MNRKRRRLLLLILLSDPNCSIEQFEWVLDLYAHDEQQFAKLLDRVYDCWPDKLTNLSNASERTTLALIAIRDQYDFLQLPQAVQDAYTAACLR